MIKPLFLAALLLCAPLYASAQSAAPSKTDTIERLRTTNAIFQNPQLNILDLIERPGSYFLKLQIKGPKGTQIAYAHLNKTSHDLILGEGFDAKGASITFPKDAQVIQRGVAFTIGNGPKHLYLATDPQCPYCVRFEQAVQGKLEGYTLHVLLFPLSFHTKAPAMIDWILAAQGDAARTARYRAILLESSKAYEASDGQSAQLQAYLPRVTAAFSELGAMGTPALFDASWRPVEVRRFLQGLQTPPKQTTRPPAAQKPDKAAAKPAVEPAQ
jgi:thiol:disulfide interchange protein DsbC